MSKISVPKTIQDTYMCTKNTVVYTVGDINLKELPDCSFVERMVLYFTLKVTHTPSTVSLTLFRFKKRYEEKIR